MSPVVGTVGGTQHPVFPAVGGLRGGECIMGFGKDGKGIMIRDTDRAGSALSTLAAGVAIKLTTSALGAITEDFRLIKLTDMWFSVTNFTAGQGPVIIGLADGELTVAEIAACLDVNGPVDRNDRAAHEASERPVWPLVAFMGDGIYGSEGGGVTLAGGASPHEKVIRWTFSNPEGADLFAFNMGSAALSAGTIRYHFRAFGVWVT